MIFRIKEHKIEIPEKYDPKFFEDEYSQEITLVDSRSFFTIIYNKVGWIKIFICRSDNSWKEFPFNEKTIELLPEGIKLERFD